MDLSVIWSFVQNNQILVLVVAYLFLTKKLTFASILSFFTGSKTAEPAPAKSLIPLIIRRVIFGEDKPPMAASDTSTDAGAGASAMTTHAPASSTPEPFAARELAELLNG